MNICVAAAWVNSTDAPILNLSESIGGQVLADEPPRAVKFAEGPTFISLPIKTKKNLKNVDS